MDQVFDCYRLEGVDPAEVKDPRCCIDGIMGID